MGFPKPRKRFGQHFLTDESVIQTIVEIILLCDQSAHLVEIGPGRGALTEPLLKNVNQLDLIELDRDLAKKLSARYQEKEGVRLYQDDALKVDFSRLAPDKKLLVVGNLPYNVATPLIFHLLTYRSHLSSMIFMLQKEVAERMAAEPGSKLYGRLSVMVQYTCEIDYLLTIPKDAFYPIPKVTSSLIRLTPYHQRPHIAEDEDLFSQLVTAAFNQRRKTLKKALARFHLPDSIWPALELNPQIRAEQLSVETFVKLSNKIMETEIHKS